MLIATRHDSHAAYVAAALDAGKHVFVEKPLALSEEELHTVESAAASSSGILMVGFNRRFAPLAMELKHALSGRGPLLITYRVNAGRLPSHHWARDPILGGGRIVGEACHFVDFASYLAGGPPTTVAATAVAGGSEPLEESFTATLRFPDGSLAQVVYTAYGDPSLPKERVEVFGEAGAGVLDDYRELRLHQHGTKSLTSGKRDKGHAAEIQAFVDGCRSGQQPWPVADMAAVMRATFDVRDGVRRPRPPSPS